MYRFRQKFRNTYTLRTRSRSTPSFGFPTNAGMQAWYDLTDANYLQNGNDLAPSPGETIKRILDKSGNNYHTIAQGTGTARPTFASGQINTRPACTFDGGDELMLPANLVALTNSDCTIIVVAKQTDSSVQRGILSLGISNTTSRLTLRYGTSGGAGSNTDCSFRSFGASGTAASVSGGINSNYQVLIGGRNDTTLSAQINNNTAGTTASGAATNDSDTGYIGRLQVAGGPLIGGIAEIIIYNRFLSVAEKLQVSLYLAEKYGIPVPGAYWITSYSPWQQMLINAWQINKDDAFTNTAANPFAAIYDPSAAALGSTTSLADTGRGVNTAIEATNPPVNTAAAIGTANGLLYNGTNTTLNAGSNTSVDDIFAAGGCYIGVVKPTTIGGGGSATDGARLFDKGGGSGGVRLQLIDNSGSTAAIRFVKDFSVANGDWRTTARDVTLGSANIIAVTYDSTSVSNDPSIYVNSLTAKGLTETVTPNLTPNSDASASMYLGNNSSNARAQDGYLGKQLFLKSVPTLAQRTAVFNFLATESGVTLT